MNSSFPTHSIAGPSEGDDLLFRSIVRNLKEIVFRTDAQGLWTFLNRAWEEITGFAVADSLGKLFLDYVHPEDRQRNQELFRPLIERKKDDCRHAIRYLRKNGGFCWVEVHARLVLDAAGDTIGTCGTITDITDRVRGQDTAKWREAILEAVSFVAESFLHGTEWEDDLPRALVLLGTAASADCVRLMERLPEQDGRPMIQLRHEWFAEDHPAASGPFTLGPDPMTDLPRWRQLLDGGEFIAGRVESLPPEERCRFERQGCRSFAMLPVFVGAHRWGQIGFSRRADQEWPPATLDGLRIAAGILGAAMQQSQTMQALQQARGELESRVRQRTMQLAAANRALSASEQLYRTLVETSPDAIVLTDIHHRILMANRRSAELFRYPNPEEQVGANFTEFIRNEDPQVVAQFRRDLLDRGRAEVDARSLTRRDGTTFQAEVSASVVHGEHGQPEEIIRIVRDVTARKQLEEQFRQAQKMEAIGRLTAGIAHDFNNVLTVIKGYSQLLAKSCAADPSSLRKVNHLVNASDRAARLVEQLMAFSRKQMAEPKILDLNASIRGMEPMLHRLIGEDIELVTQLEPAVGCIRMDPGQLDQLVMNLTVNARDAMQAHGTLTITTAPLLVEDGAPAASGLAPGTWVVLEVRDTGAGMTDEVRSRIFEPFFTTKEVGKGTGLGLAMVYGVVKQTGGHISVESAPGNGTCFRIHLPAAAGPPAAADSPHGTQPIEGRETILVAEDEDSLRAMIVDALTECGYTVLQAANGRHALNVAAEWKGPIHLLLTDVVMPQMGGPELWQSLSPAHPEMRLLYTSGYTERDVAATAPLLKKPYAPEALAMKVRMLLDAPVPTPASQPAA